MIHCFLSKHFITNIFPLRVPTLMPCYLDQHNWGIQPHIRTTTPISAPAHTLHTHTISPSHIISIVIINHSVVLEVLLNILRTFHRWPTLIDDPHLVARLVWVGWLLILLVKTLFKEKVWCTYNVEFAFCKLSRW